MSWQFMPHAPEMRSAQAAMLKSAKAPTVPKVPGYTATGLYFKKHGREVQPIFLSKKDADAALAQLPPGHGAKLEVIDLLAFLQQLVVRLEIEDPEAETLISQLELVPPSESVNFKTDLKNAGPRRAAKIFPPNHNQR